MNSVPRSEVTCERTPCLEKTWRTNSLASMGDMMVSMVRIKIDCLVRQSMMTSIVSEPLDIGSFSMKSMDIEFQGLSGIGWSCLYCRIRSQRSAVSGVKFHTMKSVQSLFHSNR